jgi:hypothetical protein
MTTPININNAINNYKKKQRKNADSGNVCAVVTQKGM